MAETRKAGSPGTGKAGLPEAVTVKFGQYAMIGRKKVVAGPSGRLKALSSTEKSAHRHPEQSGRQLVWPSGQGCEIATLQLELDQILTAISKANKAGAEGFPEVLVVTEVEEDGAEAFLLEGLVAGPIVLMTEPGAPKGLLSVVADQAEDIDLAERRLRSIFGTAIVMA